MNIQWRCRNCGQANWQENATCSHCGDGRAVAMSLNVLRSAINQYIAGPVVFNQPTINLVGGVPEDRQIVEYHEPERPNRLVKIAAWLATISLWVALVVSVLFVCFFIAVVYGAYVHSAGL